jgi:hypothetical protein
VEAFDTCILDRLSGLDVNEFDSPIDSPREEVPRRQFAPVVHPNAFRFAALRNHTVQCSRYSSAGKTSIDFEGQTLTSERVDDAQNA